MWFLFKLNVVMGVALESDLSRSSGELYQGGRRMERSREVKN